MGTPQSTTVSMAFGTALQATVTNGGNPVSGATVTFTAPGSGASATFAGKASATALTNSSGVATAPTLTANSQAGGYTVTATVSGATTPASFSLTNVAATSPIISATMGTPQSTTVSMAFGTALQATVTNGGNPVSGATVTFTAPGSGASATFAGQASAKRSPTAAAWPRLPRLPPIARPAAIRSAPQFLERPTGILQPDQQQRRPVQRRQSGAAGRGAECGQQSEYPHRHADQNAVERECFDPDLRSAQRIADHHIHQRGHRTQIGKNQTSQGDLEVWAGTNPTSSTITITGTNYFGTFQPGYGIVAEYSGISATPDGVAISTTGGTWPAVTGTLVTSNAADLLITAALSYNGGGASATVSSPWTLLTAPAGTLSLSAAWQSTQTQGSYTATWNGGGSPQAPTILLALKASGSR